MAPYRWRWRRGGRYWRRRFRKNRRFWKPRGRRWKRRRRRVGKRRRKVVTLWDPDSKAHCQIKGQTIGIITQAITTINRCYTTVWNKGKIYSKISGGGLNLQTFTLGWLFQEHRHFRNCWSKSNDGFDLAKYHGTKIYLTPHPTLDYIFFWDTDLNSIEPSDFYRLHPTRLLCSQHSIFVRSQAAGNHKTRKLKIRPPANITSQWKFMSDWCNFPLFTWGMTLINWDTIFWRTTEATIPAMTTTAVWWRDGGHGGWTAGTLAYSPLVDTGTMNIVGIYWAPQGTIQPSSGWDFIDQPYTQDLPYWFSCWGQNPSMDFNIANTGQPNQVPWARIYWPKYSLTDLTGATTPLPSLKMVSWTMTAYELTKFARMGYFVVSNMQGRCNIPFMYSSSWTWGGTQMQLQPLSLLNPCTNQVSVKNPAIASRYHIQPGDTENGILTSQALRRFIEPTTDIVERRPEPFQERPPWDAASQSYDETGSEAEESEEEQDKERSLQEIIRDLRRGIQRNKSERRRLDKFFKSLLK
nr:ORF1 [Torque teno felis virus]